MKINLMELRNYIDNSWGTQTEQDVESNQIYFENLVEYMEKSKLNFTSVEDLVDSYENSF